MSIAKPTLTPGPRHPITVEPTGRHVAVRVGGRTIAESDRALTLAEASYPPVVYVPLSDVDASALRPTDHETYCPFKGDASYWSIVTSEGELVNAVWGYEHPHDAVAEIAGHVAFYADKVEISIN